MLFQKEDIIQALVTNRAAYKKAYQELFETQKRQAIAFIQKSAKEQIEMTKRQTIEQVEAINLVRQGEVVVPTRSNPQIIANEDEVYMKAIGMFDIADGDIVDLDQDEYLRYVEDEWYWMAGFKHSQLKAKEMREETKKEESTQ
jgi:hypothetical protein